MTASRREEAPREDTLVDASSAQSGVGEARRSVAQKRVGVGDVIAEKYVVERTLGMGGMGQVLAAKHVKLGTKVAIKVVHPELAVDAEVVTRFLQEAQAMARLECEHTVRVLDVGETARGVPYIIMEHLEGQDLGAMLLERGPLPVPLALEYIRQACEALIEAHAAGIVHRDIKPQNLFVARSASGRETVRVLDFGLAKAVHGGFGVDKLTQTGHVLGSPHYMAPEQITANGVVDARTDVWSVGATLFRLLTREYPFREANAALACAAILTRDAAPIHSVRPDVPDAVAQIVARCLSRDQSRRFQSMRELAAALDHARMVVATPSRAFAPMPAPIPTPTPAAVSTPQAPPAQNAPLYVALALAALLFVLGLGGAAYVHVKTKKAPAVVPPPIASVAPQAAPAPELPPAAEPVAEPSAVPVVSASSSALAPKSRATPKAAPAPATSSSAKRGSVYDTL